MSKEILDAVTVLEREGHLRRHHGGLEDALLSAYKKTPGAAKYARVEVDHQNGDFRVYELDVPEDIEEKLFDEVEERPESRRSTRRPASCASPKRPRSRSNDWMEFRDQISERDVTPDDFGRIAAQTAKQVILQRIREAERDMTFDEYQDRIGELITGIVQQSGLALHASSCASAWRRCCRAPSRCTASATSTAPASRPSSPTSPRRPRVRASSSRAATRS